MGEGGQNESGGSLWWANSDQQLATLLSQVGAFLPPFPSAHQHPHSLGSGWPGSPVRCWMKRHTWLWGERAAEQARGPGESGLGGAAERMPALHQLLGLVEHLVPVCQLLASGIHVGAHHHPAQLVALCGEGNDIIL